MKFVALLLFETRVGGAASGYTEEIHLLDATNLAEAQASAKARGRAQETDYANAERQGVIYRFLTVTDVQPQLFESDSEALYTRSFGDLKAYRKMVNLGGPLEQATVKPSDLPALAEALQSLFDSRFRAELELDGLGFDWNGRSYGSLGVRGMEQGSVASVALSTAHDAVLEGMGEDSEHPGTLANAVCDVQATLEGWLLRLLSPDGTELRRALWHV